jgi:asparagine synthase (glutamine-hydrolysing)
MCGFIGIVSFSNNFNNNHEYINIALDDLRRRGPDQQSIWENVENNIHLAFARLAIRDLSDAGKQPMKSSDGNLVFMFNGEVYNTDYLLNWSEIEVTSLKGHSDSEVVIECMSRKGIVETIVQMDGIFAISVLNLKTNKLYLIRDHAGVKPLYAGVNEKGIVFSSHYHHITNHPYFINEIINETALTNYFKYGFITAGDGLFKNTFFIPHSNLLSIDLISKKTEFIKYKPVIRFGDKNLDEIYKYVVSSQLVSDVPIGTFLSGGVDSALTTAVASKIKPKISSFTISVNDNNLNESKVASKIASKLGSFHFIKYMNESEILDAIDQYNNSLAEPLSDFSSLLTLKVCEAAKKDFTVVLSGDGGDELFYGYSRFRNAQLFYPFLKGNIVLRFIKILYSRINGEVIPFRLLKFKNFLDFYLSSQGQTGNKEWLKKIMINPYNDDYSYVLRDYINPKTTEEALELARKIEFDIHMQRVLLKVDRASMYHSIEVRTPMLSTEMCSKAFQFDFISCQEGIVNKKPLREILQQYFDYNEIGNKAKKGFEPPMASWLRNELKQIVQERIFLTPLLLKPFISNFGIKQIWNDHQTGKFDYSCAIWSLYSLFTWIEKK